MNRTHGRYGAAVATLALAGVTGHALAAEPAPVRKDCTPRDCPELTIQGDGVSRYPNGRPAAFRGFADPCLRRDPVSGALWMVYSWPHIEQRGGRRHFSVGVETHLASSTDGGRTWRRTAVLWPKTPGRSTDPRTGAATDGFVSHEVPNIVPITTDAGPAWVGVRLDYFLGSPGNYRARDPQSFCLRLMTAPSPERLGRAEPITLALSEVAAGRFPVDVDLGRLSRDLPGRFIPNEPALFFQDGRLYLAFVAMAFSGSTPDFPRSVVVVLSTEPKGAPRSWTWRYNGILAAHREARELGADALTQVELTKSRDGGLLALLTPEAWDAELARKFGSDPFGGIVHKGVVAVEVASLETPALARRSDGTLSVRAILTASKGGERGPGAAGYDPASETGVLFTLRDIVEKEYLAWSLHRTRLHP